MKWVDLIFRIITVLPLLAALIGGLFYYRDNKNKKRLENQHAAVSIKIDEATHNKLVQDAANINQDREREREEWWAKQVRTLRDEIDAERRLSNRRFKRLNQIEEWAMLHVAWDRKAWAKILATDPGFESPPMLPEELLNGTGNGAGVI